MALQSDLVGAGLYPLQAELLGDNIVTVAGAGTTQGAGTTIVPGNTIVLGTTAGGALAFTISASWPLATALQFTNTSSTTASLFPPTGAAINGGSTNAAISVPQNVTVELTRVSNTSFVGEVSAGGAGSFTSLAVSGTASVGGVATMSGIVYQRGAQVVAKQVAPTAKTVTSAITAAELVTGIITTTGATAPSVHQLPTGTLLLAEFPNFAAGDSFDFSVINTGTGASDDATITVNTDVTIVGNATIGSLTDATIISGSGRFRARYTGGVTWIVYRLS